MDGRDQRQEDGELARLRVLVAQAPTLIALLEGPEHVFRVANPAYLRAVGRDEGTVVGRPFRDVFPEIAGQGFYELLDRAYASGAPEVGTARPVRFAYDGEGSREALFDFVFQPARDATGAVEAILINAVEVTAQAEAQGRVDALAREARAERDRLQQGLDVLPEGVVVADATGRVAIANSVARELLGAGIVGRSLADAERGVPGGVPGTGAPLRQLDGTPYPAGGLPVERTLARGEAVRGVQLLLHAADGRAVPALLNSAPLRDSTGVAGAVVVFQDITTIRNFEQARDALLSTVAHDLKTPLTAIQGLAELTGEQAQRRGTPSSERVAARQEAIVTAASQMTALLNELLDAMQLEMGQPLALDRRPVDLAALVRRTVDHQQELAGRVVRAEVDVPEVVVEIDADRIERVIGNLVSNAIKYSPPGGDVRVRLTQGREATRAWAVLTVRDHGRGIPAADLPHVFERFRRGENAGGVQGAGIGLASVREIVEQHGGTVTIESREGTGATATVRLPLPGSEAS